MPETEIRTKIDDAVLVYLGALNGHQVGESCKPGDVARAALYLAAYIQMIANPLARPLKSLVTECEEQAAWLFEPGTFQAFLAGLHHHQVTEGAVPAIAPHSKQHVDFIATLPDITKDTTYEASCRVQFRINKHLWGLLRKELNIKYGNQDEAMQGLLTGFLLQKRTLAGERTRLEPDKEA